MRLFDMKVCEIVPNFKFKSEWCVLIAHNIHYQQQFYTNQFSK